MATTTSTAVGTVATGDPTAEFADRPSMDATLRQKWIDALRSGKFRQAQYTLKDEDGGYCCIGVLCKIQRASFAKLKKDRGTLQIAGTLPRALTGGLEAYELSALSRLNDCSGKSFAEIADYIEQNISTRSEVG